LTVALVVSGPGVNNSLSILMGILLGTASEEQLASLRSARRMRAIIRRRRAPSRNVSLTFSASTKDDEPVRSSLIALLLLAGAARADEFGTQAARVSNWIFEWGGYLHVAYRYVEQPSNYQLAGRNNGFQLEQARLGANVIYKNVLAVRVSFEGASEDRLSQSFPGGTLTVRLRDAYITWAPLRWLRATIGQMVTPWDLDSMRSDSELPFVSRAVPIEGVQPNEGRALGGIGADRSLGIALHSGDIPLGAVASMRYQLLVGNGNGQNQLLNDNNMPAVFGRLEFAAWGMRGPPPDVLAPMRARTDGPYLPYFNLGLAAQYVPRTTGNPPDLINETDTGFAVDAVVAFWGVDLEGGLVYVKTTHDTLSSTPDLERLGWWAHLRYTLPRIPVEITPGYRIASYAPRAHLSTTAAPGEAQRDSDLGLLYHTFGVTLRPTRFFPLHLDVNYTLTEESGANVLDNDRFEADVVAVF
jgi:hypothetical protein